MFKLKRTAKSETIEYKNTVTEQQQNDRIICGNSTKLLNTISEIFEVHFCSNQCCFICTSMETIRKWMTVGRAIKLHVVSICSTHKQVEARKKQTHSNEKYAWIIAGNEENSVLWWFEHQQKAQNQHTAASVGSERAKMNAST